MSKYQVFEPGKYLDWEKEIIEGMIALTKGDVPQGPPPEGMPATSNEATEYELLKYNQTWDPYNPLFNDKAHAQSAGYQDIPAWPCFKRPMPSVRMAIPKDIAELFYYHTDGGNVELFTPIYAGDTFESKTDRLYFDDITIPGSDLRAFHMGAVCSLYNQKGELVVRNTTSNRESYRKILDGSPAPSFSENVSKWVKDFPPAHYTTDEEWEYIKELWGKEYIRGKDTLYWEDVNIGDEPTWICTGPISHMDMIAWHGGQVTSRRDLLDRANVIFRDQYGQYLPEVSIHYGGRNIPGSRMLFYNNTGAMHIARMITNYISDAGFLTKIIWRFRGLSGEIPIGRPGGEFLDKVPYMKGKGCTVHGSEGDTVIAKGYVTDKYINDRGEHIIDLTCWAETLDDNIVQVVSASARLPSKSK